MTNRKIDYYIKKLPFDVRQEIFRRIDNIGVRTVENLLEKPAGYPAYKSMGYTEKDIANQSAKAQKRFQAVNKIMLQSGRYPLFDDSSDTYKSAQQYVELMKERSHEEICEIMGCTWEDYVPQMKPMRTLVLSDIHANLPALQAVLADAGEFDRLVFLGDLANFGPHPSECVELLMKYDPICIIGNHDEQIVSDEPKHFWDKWAKRQLSPSKLEWMSRFQKSAILDGHILLLHGSYNVDYDILPNTHDENIAFAFRGYFNTTDKIDEIWFGHYHYQLDRTVSGITYRCIRPVGHHRDKDTRASYSIYENGVITHKRVEYDLRQTVEDFKKIDAFTDDELKQKFVDFLENAYHAELLDKDIKQMQRNDHE